MTGLLIVEEAFNTDITLHIRDFRLGKDGQFIALSVPRNAVLGGTPRTVSTANWQVDGVTEVPTGGGLIRLRLVVTDPTRVFALSVTDAADFPLIAPQTTIEALLAHGQPADYALRMPATGEMQILMTQGGLQDRPACPVARHRHAAEPRPRGSGSLPPNPVPEPDLANAESVELTIGWTPEAASAAIPPSSCRRSTGRSGPVTAPILPPRLATVTRGRTCILRLRNETQDVHPIHLHGHAFRLLRSTTRVLAQITTDTALLQAQETVEVALGADNPGDWVLHCHVIEHQKTGLSTCLRVA